MTRKELDGGCYVVNLGDVEYREHGSWAETPVINRTAGAVDLSLLAVRVTTGTTPSRIFSDSDAVIYVMRGNGTISVSGTEFSLVPQSAAYVKPGESLEFTNTDTSPLVLLLCVCPPCEEVHWARMGREDFDDTFPQRTVLVNKQNMQATGDRFYQILVDQRIGSGQLTQFVGRIPKSKAKEHFHLYEEAIVVLSGCGYMWTGNSKASVNPGSVIYLPRRQPHCLECTSDDGMVLVGHFYPAGSPAVSY